MNREIFLLESHCKTVVSTVWIPTPVVFMCLLILLQITTHAQSFDESTTDVSQLVMEGFTEPYRDIQIGSPDTGTVTEIRVDEGSFVRFGQVVARLDDTVMRANMNVAREAAASTGELEAAQLQMQANIRKYEQLLELHGRNHATDQELWNLQTVRDESIARVKAYDELASRRRLELLQAEAQLERLTIHAPIDGVVIKRCKDVGEIVSPADPHLLRVVQLDPLRISATATWLQSRSLNVGQALQVTVGDHSTTATIEFVSPVADASSGTVLVQLRVANPDQKIAGGMPCQVSLTPPSALKREPDRSIPRQTLKQFPLMIKSR